MRPVVSKITLLISVPGILAGLGCRRAIDANSGATPLAPRPVVLLTDVSIEIKGPSVAQPTIFTFGQLADMGMVRLDNVLMEKPNEPDEKTSWAGPPLATLLSAARVAPGPMRLTLEASDGYCKRCSSRELSDAIIALCDGEGHWLHELDETCPLRLVPPHLPGDYWIANVCSITVEPLDGAPGAAP